MILAGHDREVAEWIASRCPHLELVTPYTAIGVVKDGKLIGGVMYDNFTGINIDTHCAGEGPWLSRGMLREIFGYPFEQLKVTRVTARVAASNLCSLKLVRALGYVFEGTLRHALRDGDNLCLYGMLRHECRWVNYGRKQPTPDAAARISAAAYAGATH